MGTFSLEFVDEVSNKLAEEGGAEVATLGEPTQEIKSLNFRGYWGEGPEVGQC